VTLWRGSAKHFFEFLVRMPAVIVAIAIVIFLAGAFGLTKLEKDVRSDAFLASDNPALVYRDVIKEVFGLSDPMVLIVVADQPEGIFTSQNLVFIRWLSDAISSLPNIDQSKLLSLATQNNIRSGDEGIEIVPFLDTMPSNKREALELKEQIDNFPLYVGSLVAKTGLATVIVAEMRNEKKSGESYRDVLSLLESAPIPGGVQVHVAGEAAISGYMGRYIDNDAERLVPFTALAILLILLIAYRRIGPVVQCAIVMASTIVVTLGTMALLDVPFYVITSALPVILIGISVADAIHVYSHYFHLTAHETRRDTRELVVEVMQAMWRPISLTSLTTIAGFLGLYFSADMPPFKYFGLFCAYGVSVAWAYSLLFLPAVIVLCGTRQGSRSEKDAGYSGRIMSFLGRLPIRYSRSVVLVFSLIVLAGFYAATEVRVDDDPISIFHAEEPIAIADRMINQHTNGSNTLDVVVETQATEELFDPVKLAKIEALQLYISTLPNVGGSVSIVDYLKQMNRAMNDNRPEEYRLPSTREAVAQYFLIYAAMSDPTDFEEEVDYDYRLANVRVNLTSGGYQATKTVVDSLELYLAKHFNDAEMHANLSGRVQLNYQWIKELAASHFSGMFVALVLVWVVSSLLFRSEIAGFYTLIPVGGAVLGVYTVMVLNGITLGMGTSMFAAIAIGLGIDFSIHTLDRLRVLTKSHKGNLNLALVDFYPSTGKALFFNFLAVACGFGVLLASDISSLTSFGGIVMLSIGFSFIASMILLPALLLCFRPKFLFLEGNYSPGGYFLLRLLLCASVLLFLVLSPFSSKAFAEEKMLAGELVQRVNDVAQGHQVTRKLSMEMIDRRGKSRFRETIGYRQDFDEGRKTVLFYLTPANVRDTAFLTWDYDDPLLEDDQWLYLPALRKVRRISAGDRGGYFLGTDFTYEDIKQDGRLSTIDYDYTVVPPPDGYFNNMRDADYTFLEAVPKTKVIAAELGYSRTVIMIDKKNWIVRGVEFWDTKSEHLKTLNASEVEKVQNIWTRVILTMENHQTGHKTTLTLSGVDYDSPVQSSRFSKQSITRGH
jgi:predicted RND superfamily exporter protein/outer membrane lipoprotein-sorting protein